MFGKDLLIKKYPYIGNSPNMMEYFAIIGYQDNFISILIDTFSKINKNPYSPTFLSSINSKIDYGTFENYLIISQVYPDNPLIIQINKNDIDTEPPETSNVIFCFCYDSKDGKTKLFYNCFAFKFYEKYNDYYIPKAFCIISQYSFFNSFEYICRNIYTLMTEQTNNILPVELIIYNIINYIPSPMNYFLQLDLFSFIYLNAPIIQLNQLSGYPYIDFDLKEVFNLLPINLFLEIYLFTIIEQKILFFSSNLEILNMIMYIMYILNYPCNDSNYFWHIVSVSKNNIKLENEFAGKPYYTLLGVHAAYDDTINTSDFGQFFIVDIDNKKFFLKESSDKSEEDKNDAIKLSNLQTYIENIIKEKNIESSFLKPFIIRLKKKLESIINKEQDPNPAHKVKFKGFFRMNNSIYNTNKLIQEIFYDFCLNILMIFYQDNIPSNKFDKLQKKEWTIKEQNKKINSLEINDVNIDMSEEEKYFCTFFRISMKYNKYFECYMQYFQTLDVFKIAFLFSEEFINIKMKDSKNKILNKLSLFKIIDTLYYQNNKQIINITVNNLFSLYLDKLKNYFEEYIENDKYVKSKLINLNKKILNKYIYLLNNYFEKDEIMDLFPSIRIQKEQPIIDIDRRYIINIIQNYLEVHINKIHYLIYGLVYIFCITISLHSYYQINSYLAEIFNKSLSKLDYFLRQYGYIIIQSFYKYLMVQEEKQDIYPQLDVANIRMFYFMLINFLNQRNVIPNEEMVTLFFNFFEKFQEKSNISGKEKIGSDIDFKFKKNVDFFCFMKHCFCGKNYYKSSTMIKSGLKEKRNCNIIITLEKNITLKQTIEIKIKDYIYSTQFFSAKKIFKLSEKCFNEFYETYNLDFTKLEIKNVRDCIANLIQYGLELDNIIPVTFLVNSLYLLRNYEEQYQQKNK